MKHGATLAVVAVLLLACVALAGDHPLLVTPAWLAERLGRADVRIVDLSDAEDYAKGHIPGALHLDLADARMQASEGVFRVPTAEEGRRLFARQPRGLRERLDRRDVALVDALLGREILPRRTGVGRPFEATKQTSPHSHSR